MRQTQGLLLPDISDRPRTRTAIFDCSERPALSIAAQRVFEFYRAVEMVFDCPFAATSDDHDVLYASGASFFDGVLNERPIDQWQHLHGHRFRRWKESIVEPACGDDRPTNCVSRHGLMRSVFCRANAR